MHALREFVEAHSEYMWKEKHLKAIPKARAGCSSLSRGVTTRTVVVTKETIGDLGVRGKKKV